MNDFERIERLLQGNDVLEIKPREGGFSAYFGSKYPHGGVGATVEEAVRAALEELEYYVEIESAGG